MEVPNLKKETFQLFSRIADRTEYYTFGGKTNKQTKKTDKVMSLKGINELMPNRYTHPGATMA